MLNLALKLMQINNAKIDTNNFIYIYSPISIVKHKAN